MREISQCATGHGVESVGGASKHTHTHPLPRGNLGALQVRPPRSGGCRHCTMVLASNTQTPRKACYRQPTARGHSRCRGLMRTGHFPAFNLADGPQVTALWGLGGGRRKPKTPAGIAAIAISR